MTHIPKHGKCITCLQERDDITKEHLFPRSWYPDSTPPNLEKWKVPSCSDCNGELGDIENDLMVRIGLCLDPKDPDSLGIPAKALRAINPKYGKGKIDRDRRAAKRVQIMKEAFHGSEIPEEGIHPNFGNIWNLGREDQLGIRISAASIERVNDKIVRGITYLEDNAFIQPPLSLSFFNLHDRNGDEIRNLLTAFGSQYAREPGIRVTRATSNSRTILALYAIEIWGRWKMYASVNNFQ